MPVKTKNEPDNEAVAVYNEHVLVISELKKSQWQHGVTMFALFGALLALRKDIQHALDDCWLHLFAIVVPLLLAGGGIWVAAHAPKRTELAPVALVR